MTGQGCNLDWCWFCGRPGHTEEAKAYATSTGISHCQYNCNSSTQSEYSSKINNQNDQHKFLRYFDRYLTTTTWLKAEKDKFLQSVEDRTNELMNNREDFPSLTSDSNFTFDLLLAAARAEIECRAVLANTYILGYFLGNQTSPHHQSLFDMYQSNLEEVSDCLNKLNRAALPTLVFTDFFATLRRAKKYIENMRESISNIAACISSTPPPSTITPPPPPTTADAST